MHKTVLSVLYSSFARAVHLTRLEARAGASAAGEQLTNLAIDPNVRRVHRLVSRSQALLAMSAANANASTTRAQSAEPPSFLSMLQQRFATLRESASANKTPTQTPTPSAPAANQTPAPASGPGAASGHNDSTSGSLVERPDGIELSQLPVLEVRAVAAAPLEFLTV